MKLKDIIKCIAINKVEGNADIDIVDIDIDSRKAAAGHLFVAIKGTQTDGHQYIAKAIELGASAVLCEEMPAELDPHVCYVHSRFPLLQKHHWSYKTHNAFTLFSLEHPKNIPLLS